MNLLTAVVLGALASKIFHVKADATNFTLPSHVYILFWGRGVKSVLGFRRQNLVVIILRSISRISLVDFFASPRSYFKYNPTDTEKTEPTH